MSRNICRNILDLQLHDYKAIGFQRNAQVTTELVKRIGLEINLEGHDGCVNCLEWNETGTLLASGSDDTNIIIWDPFKRKLLTLISSGHSGNVFSVKFLPNCNDSIVVSGAADCRIAVHDIRAGETTRSYTSHMGRVKRIATAPDLPYMFWSAAEDGTIMQFDLREPFDASKQSPHNVLVNLNLHMGNSAEAKCLAINPLRPELLAVGTNDPYVRLYDRRMLTCHSVTYNPQVMPRYTTERENFLYMLSTADFTLPSSGVQYYVAGHLPQKQLKKYRTLASTYLTFSPDGRELLVNLGGEQVYLFDINHPHHREKFQVPMLAHANGLVKEASSTNGYHIPPVNGKTVIPNLTSDDKPRKRSCHVEKPLPLAVEAIKQQANSVFEKQQFNQAILLYNQAISMASNSPVLYSNRAAAYMKRNWDGDLYAALRDCHRAIQLDRDHLKAHFRLAKCLYELSWISEASECLCFFKDKFPDYATSKACISLDRDIKAAVYSQTDTVSAAADEDSKSNDDHFPLPGQFSRRSDKISDQEKQLREAAYDYEQRFCGHCNTTTDIKEANFFGSNGQYIVAGSDDGSFFIWERSTANIVRVLKGDNSIVNCLQPHPSSCILATSGIDKFVRLWTPKPEDGKKDDREVDNSDDAAMANQRRMNADPLEVMLMNMGYRITGVLDGEEEEDREAGEGPIQCRPS